MQKLARLPVIGALGILTLALIHCGDDEPSCTELANDAKQARIDFQDAAEHSCEMDSDCTIVDNPLRCAGGCGYESSIARSAKQAVAAEVAGAERDYCGSYESRGCPAPIIPPCGTVGVANAVCRDGRCKLEVIPDQ